MNRIYKTVWNEQCQTFVAVVEAACARGKRSGRESGGGAMPAFASANHRLSLGAACWP
ncbi:hypothetical protein H0A73_08515 [Alcaligenaceae bacterium]|nr:hypothetical protein [Alcaligenaceae bacterium]